jgi:hypothetical protein
MGCNGSTNPYHREHIKRAHDESAMCDRCFEKHKPTRLCSGRPENRRDLAPSAIFQQRLPHLGSGSEEAKFWILHRRALGKGKEDVQYDACMSPYIC